MFHSYYYELQNLFNESELIKILLQFVDDYLLNHGALLEDERELARIAFDTLFDLYQLIGRRHVHGEDK